MKKMLLICFTSIALALGASGQTVTPAVASTSQPTPAVTTSATPEDEDSIESEVERKLKHKFKKLGITIDTDRGSTHVTRHNKDGDDDEDFGALMAIPIVGIIFTTLFGAPVLVVAAIMFFSYLKSRSLHRTVRMMVEKGQEVPAALFAPPTVVRARSDMRRGVILLMVGLGSMVFFGAVNDWEGGAWSLGAIPFVIGLGYLLVWKLESRRDKTPPLP